MLQHDVVAILHKTAEEQDGPGTHPKTSSLQGDDVHPQFYSQVCNL